MWSNWEQVTSVGLLGRNTRDLLNIIHDLTGRGIRFHKEGITVGGEKNVMWNLMLTILAGMAKMEREMMLLRQSEGIAAARAAGRTMGRGNSAWIDRDGIIAARANGQSL